MEAWNIARGWLRNAGFACVILSPMVWIVSLLALGYGDPISRAPFIFTDIGNYLTYIGVALLFVSMIGRRAEGPGIAAPKRNRAVKIADSVYVSVLWFIAAVAALRLTSHIVFDLLWKPTLSNPSPEFWSFYNFVITAIVTLIVISLVLFIAAWLFRAIVRRRVTGKV